MHVLVEQVKSEELSTRVCAGSRNEGGGEEELPSIR